MWWKLIQVVVVIIGIYLLSQEDPQAPNRNPYAMGIIVFMATALVTAIICEIILRLLSWYRFWRLSVR